MTAEKEIYVITARKYVRHYFAMVFVMLLIVMLPAYSQEQSIVVSTDRSTYAQGDSIVVTGTVTTAVIENVVLLQMLRSGTVEGVAQLEVAQDGTYAHVFPTNEDYSTGQYRIVAHYGDINNETEFVMTEAAFRQPTRSIDIDPVDCTWTVDGGTLGNVPIGCSIAGGTVDRMYVDVNVLGVIVDITSDSDGTITLDLPTRLIDASDDLGNRMDFIVRIDGVQVDYTERQSGTTRSIDVDFVRGESTIEVIGTMAVPEFGTVALIVTALGLAAAVIIIRRPGLQMATRPA